MPGFSSLSLRAGLIAGVLLAAGANGSLAQEKVGINSAVNPDATGTPPNAPTRQLVIGQDVVFNEHIRTGNGGQTQLLFLDESAMSIGPNSDLTIDQFVYDPQSGTGKLAMSATRGLLRYVGGKLSKQDSAVTLRTSTATLAVRGGAFVAIVAPDGTTNAIFIYGKGLTITGTVGGSQTITRPGYSSTTTAGSGPSTPGPAPAGLLTAATQALDGRSGGSGGATSVPSGDTGYSALTQTVSGDITQSVQQSVQNGGGSGIGTGTGTVTTASIGGQFTPPIPSTVGTTAVNSCANPNNCGSTSGGTFVGGGGGGTGGGGGATVPPVTVTYAGRLKNTNGQGTAKGFVDQSTLGDIAYSAGTLSGAGVFTASVGALGTISFPLALGSANFSNGNSSTLGTLSGTTFLSADGSFFYASITPTSQPSQRVFITGGTPVKSSALQQTGTTRILAFSVQPDTALQSNIPFVRSQAGGNLPNASVSPLYVAAPPTTPIGDATTNSAARALQSSLAINGQGANQQSTIVVTTGTFATLQSSGQPALAGHMRGSSLQTASGTPMRLGSKVGSTVDGAGNSIYGSSAISGFVIDQSQPNETASGSGILTTPTPSTANEIPLSGTATSYGFAQPVLPQAVPSGVGTNRTTQAMSGNFGGLMYTTAQANPYIATGGTLISTDAPNNRISATLTGSADSTASAGVSALVMEYGALNGNSGGREAFIDNSTFGVLESQVRPQQVNGTSLSVNDISQGGKLYLVSSGAAGAPTALLPTGVSYCQCQFLQWGYWGGDLATGTAAGTDPTRIDRGHINTWVAGVPTPVGDLNTLAAQAVTNTYNGHAIGSVFNNGASYAAAGGFNGSYNFATQNGTFSLTNFDGHSFTTSGKAPLTGANYTFGLSSAGLKGTVNGTFYGSGANAAAETGGSFAFQTTVGPTYLASGIYAGKKP